MCSSSYPSNSISDSPLCFIRGQTRFLTLAPFWLLNAEAIFLYLKSLQCLRIYSPIEICIFYKITIDSEFMTLALEEIRVHIKHCLPFDHRESKSLLIFCIFWSYSFYICLIYFSVNFSWIDHTTISSSQCTREPICSIIYLRRSFCLWENLWFSRPDTQLSWVFLGP